MSMHDIDVNVLSCSAGVAASLSRKLQGKACGGRQILAIGQDSVRITSQQSAGENVAIESWSCCGVLWPSMEICVDHGT
jgi:hypothetical protein